MANLTLRIKTKNGQHVLNKLSSDLTFEQLKDKIAELTKIPAESVKILQGFPPKPVAISNGMMSLSDMKFTSGDTLIIQEDAAAVHERTEKQSVSLLKEIENQEKYGGILRREVVPANNSCLFTSFSYVLEENGRLNLAAAEPLRQMIAGIVMSDPDTYSEAMLGKNNLEYCRWIMNNDSWGGAIEISILSKYYEIEIDVVDTQTVRIDRFGEDQNYSKRVLLIYDGLHYDALVLEPTSPVAPLKTKFSTKDDCILQQALELAAEANASRQFTDVSKFNLRCLICQTGLVGQSEAQTHAKQTGHINFGEY